MASQNQLAEAQRLDQAAISAEVTQRALALWMASYEPRNPSAWKALTAALQMLVSLFRSQSARSATNYYIASRTSAGTPGLHVPKVVAAAPPELVETAAQITGARTYGQALGSGATQEQARRNSGVHVAGAMARVALDAGRQTVLEAVDEDREAIGWIRITDADPCAFCAMLASRGPVYSEDTAAFQAHPHCACIAAPVWSRAEAWLGHSEDLYQQWKSATAGHAGKDALREWRRYWRNRDNAA